MTATKARKKSAQAAPKAQAAKGVITKGVAKSQGINGATGTFLDGEITVNGSKPEPVPGDKGFDWQAEYPGEKVFVYTSPKEQTTARGEPCGGRTVGLAAISEHRQPDVGFMFDIREKQEFDQVVDMIKLVAGPAAISVIRPWQPKDLQPMFEAWNEWQHTTAGKP